MVSCSKCEGEKEQTCGTCAGNGDAPYGGGICSRCEGGSGEITCTNCDENGEVECSMCKDGSDG